MNPTPASQPTLLFIPDISGFTQFVNDTAISHSQHIIEELLEILIDANEIDLVVSEIEGDAILFYREGPAPTAAELLAQVQRMYVKFHAHLKKYETHRICQCGACCTANRLALKFVVHYGPIAQKQVKEYSKLFGREVIVAHRLMKNEVPHQEYVLFTHQLINACSTWVQVEQAAWSDPEQGEGAYDFGSVRYCYLTLDPLQAHVPEPTLEDHSLPGATVQVSAADSVIEAPMELVFDVLSDLAFRHEWMDGLIGSDKLNHKLAQAGATHRCVIKGDASDPFFVMHDFKQRDDMITFTDTNHDQGYCTVFTLRQIGKQITRIEAHNFIKQNFFKKLMFDLFMKKKIAQSYVRTFANLNEYCKQLVLEGKQHPTQIVLQQIPVAA